MGSLKQNQLLHNTLFVYRRDPQLARLETRQQRSGKLKAKTDKVSGNKAQSSPVAKSVWLLIIITQKYLAVVDSNRCNITLTTNV